MEIKFIPYKKDTEFCFLPPVAAKRTMPQWFTKMPLHTGNEKKFRMTSSGQVNQTAKYCSPFLDTFMVGYTICLAVDLLVEKNGDTHNFVWKTGRPIEGHSRQQVASEQYQDRYSPDPFKFMNEWIVKTPKNYSTLFTHPLNRTDLPFVTLSGVVDTDSFSVPINFPFLLEKDFEGLLEKGTPIVQLLPFKREKWSSKTEEYSEKYSLAKGYEYFSKIERPYKNMFWHKKDYS